MNDVTSTTPPAQQPLPNDPASRTPDGQIKDASATTTPQDSTTEPTTSSTEPSKDQQPADDKTKSADKPAGPPEKYEFKAPEGFTLDDAAIDSFSAKAKELGLSQEAAQSLVDFYADLAKTAANAPFQAYQDTRAGWVKEVIADKALGNGKDGLSAETQAAIGRVKDLLDPDLRSAFEEAMDFTGAGDNPAFIRTMLALSKYAVEGRPVPAGNPSTPANKAPSAAQALWPSLPSANRS